MLYILSLIMKPIFNGIAEEQNYAQQLQEFFNHYLIRIRPNRRYNLAKSVYRLKHGYIFPKPENLEFLKRLVNHTHRIMKKKTIFWSYKIYV